MLELRVLLYRHLLRDPGEGNIRLRPLQVAQRRRRRFLFARHRRRRAEHAVHADEIAAAPQALARHPHGFAVIAADKMRIGRNPAIDSGERVARTCAQSAVISGNPFAQGEYVLRLKMPAGYKIAAHNHPTNENVTVISGTFHLGMGDKLDEKKSITLTAGGFALAQARMNHYAWAETPTIVQVHGIGPFAITYVNPEDDPSM